MTEYQMPALSEQEREELIAECKSEIEEGERVLAHYYDKAGSYAHESLKRKVLRQKIALAALTAEPVGDVHEVGVLPEGGDVLAVEWHSNLQAGDKVYTVPPVPVKQEGEQ